MVKRLRQYRRKAVALLVLVCSFFAQYALAAQPCLLSNASPADAFAPMPDCHQPPAGNLCLAECTELDQTSGPSDAGILPLPAPVATVAAVIGAHHSINQPPPSFVTVRTVGPPPYLRLCSLLL
jgi:hypothetical protein